MKKLVFAALLIPVMGHATTFSCKAIQEGHIDSGSQKVSVDSTFDIQDKKMTINLGGKTWRLDFVGKKSIAKMYATPDGGVAATYIDNGSIPIFVLRPSNPDGEMAVYTLSMCSEV
ncbi:hypothetical protein [Escherichia albertii]|uniref:hypothetical protein n=1 Tax=Escherichia albertii TaxID=208962 RepID=UPI0010F5BF47|nr:hypothetical protein [Escherichia albertii]